MSTRSPAVVIRRATADDTAAVAAADKELFGADAWPPDLVAAGDTREVVVAEVDGTLAGYAVLSVAGDVADLERIAVVAAHRRTGLATTLLGAVRARARAAAAERLLLEVSEANGGARAFYAAHGAVEVARRRRYYRDGSDALVLELPLSGGKDRG